MIVVIIPELNIGPAVEWGKATIGPRAIDMDSGGSWEFMDRERGKGVFHFFDDVDENIVMEFKLRFG